VHQVLDEIGVKDKPELLLLNKIDTPQGEHHAHTWRTMNPNAIPISAKTGAGIDRLIEAVTDHVRGQQLEVTLEAEVTNGKLISFIEHQCRVHEREFEDGQIIIHATMGKRTLADLSHNPQVHIKTVKSVK
jgi:GTP-binding protein HflX